MPKTISEVLCNDLTEAPRLVFGYWNSRFFAYFLRLDQVQALANCLEDAERFFQIIGGVHG